MNKKVYRAIKNYEECLIKMNLNVREALLAISVKDYLIVSEGSFTYTVLGKDSYNYIITFFDMLGFETTTSLDEETEHYEITVYV